MPPKKTKIRLILLLLVAAIAQVSFAQPLSLSLYQKSADTTGFAEKTETTPRDDEVLSQAPDRVGLVFPERARLVKFTLRTQDRDWIDVQFRYQPRQNTEFVLALPELAMATYYTAEWAVLAKNDRLLRGSFSFAFGENAKPPSVIRAEQELLLEQRYGDPTIRYVKPPDTEIILGREPPEFDPPFTIQLEESGSNNPLN